MLPIKKKNIDDFISDVSNFIAKEKPDGSYHTVYVLKLKRPTEELLKQSVNGINEGDLDEKMDKLNFSEKEKDLAVKNRTDSPSLFEQLNWPTYVLESDECYYVGYTADLRTRMRQHFVTGSGFTEKLEPVSLDRVEWFESEKVAREMEISVADEISTLTYSPRHRSKQPSTKPFLLRKWSDDSEKKIFAYGGAGRGVNIGKNPDHGEQYLIEDTEDIPDRIDSFKYESGNGELTVDGGALSIELLGLEEFSDLEPSWNYRGRKNDTGTVLAIKITNNLDEMYSFPMLGHLKVVDDFGFDYEQACSQIFSRSESPGIDYNLESLLEESDTRWTTLNTDIDSTDNGYYALYIQQIPEKISKILYITGYTWYEFGGMYERPRNEDNYDHVESYSIEMSDMVEVSGLPTGLKEKMGVFTPRNH